MIAVLGLGSIGLRHARNLLSLGVRVIGYDPSEERRSMLAAEGGLPAVHRDEALAAATAAVIASPSGRHFDDMRAGLDAGCHLFVEKPLAHTTEGLAALLDQADESGKVVAVGFNLRHHPAVLQAHRAIREGHLGRPLWARLELADYLPHWRPGTDFRQGYANDPKTGGVIFDIVHEFDLAAFLLGVPEVKACVAAHTGTLGLESEDLADMVLVHPGGAQSLVHVDFVSRPRRRHTLVYGTEAAMHLDLDARKLSIVRGDGVPLAEHQFPGAYADDYLDEMTSFLACCRGEAQPSCPGREALDVLDRLITARRIAGLPS
ncbi:MAG: Gfo/Idh/MocA family oxidoreductase [Alphaproteobacteria bacterium]|nr:Gfo/Idh/MocA family oxidoreductase [Alphaproteobacteria bacterium]